MEVRLSKLAPMVNRETSATCILKHFFTISSSRDGSDIIEHQSVLSLRCFSPSLLPDDWGSTSSTAGETALLQICTGLMICNVYGRFRSRSTALGDFQNVFCVYGVLTDVSA